MCSEDELLVAELGLSSTSSCLQSFKMNYENGPHLLVRAAEFCLPLQDERLHEAFELIFEALGAAAAVHFRASTRPGWV